MRVAITGATSGLGWELAKVYASKGNSLLLSGRDPDRLEEISMTCSELGADVVSNKIDVTDTQAMESWLTTADRESPIDVVIANAGLGGADVMVADHGESSQLARQIIEVNSIGVFNTVTPLIPKMAKRGAGHIVIIGSISALNGLPQSPVYCASKSALKVYADAIRRLLKPQGVQVTSVLPGFVDTPMSRSIGLPRPWLWTSEKAAMRIMRDVERGAAHCIFPWQFRFLIGLQNLLPTAIGDQVLRLSIKLGSGQK